jgi:hypothetical protein
MAELKPCPECNCTGVAETIGGYDRPCDACSGMGEIRSRAAPRGHIVYLCESEGDCQHDWRTEKTRTTLARIKENSHD